MSDVWTPERVEVLTRLWGKGLSITGIGKQMGLSRNAVVGKAMRLGLPRRPSPIKKRRDLKVPTRAERKRLANARRPKVVLDHSSGCRWPMWQHKARPGDEGYGVVCGHEIERGSYCAAHREMAYRRKAEASDEAEAA